MNGDTVSEVKTIFPYENDINKNTTTFCDQTTEDGGWTVILNREPIEVKEDFNRIYVECENGFGDRNGEFWLGLKSIHQLTFSQCSELMVEMEDYNSTEYMARYSEFSVGSPSKYYVLYVAGFSSTPTIADQLSYHRGKNFTAKDRDQDTWGGNCAERLIGPWWYGGCFKSKLMGNHFNGTHAKYQGIHWNSITGLFQSLKKASMKIRRCQ